MEFLLRATEKLLQRNKYAGLILICLSSENVLELYRL